MPNEFNIVGLYDHNAESYRKVRDAYNSGENVVGIVHATGTVRWRNNGKRNWVRYNIL